ncbi:MAG: TlpA family protein disulfide reductase [Gammaproteobacteria bacterium]|nr:TlpA family protein disulfide reductase [Gammaproteobacteria bacterium]
MKTRDQTVPNVKLLTLSGDSVQLDALVRRHRGRPVVINLWASWCPPCRAEMPLLEEAQRRYPGILFLSANQGESFAAVLTFLQSENLKLNHVLLDPRQQLGRRVLPTTLLYYAQGKLIDLHRGMFSRATLAHALEQFDLEPINTKPGPVIASALDQP